MAEAQPWAEFAAKGSLIEYGFGLGATLKGGLEYERSHRARNASRSDAGGGSNPVSRTTVSYLSTAEL